YAATTAGSYTVLVTNPGGCSATSSPLNVTVNPAATATFAYGASAYCLSGSNPRPTISGTSGGTFSSTSGLSINASTGTINLAASTPGSYTVTYSVGGACPASATAAVTITAPANAAFSYAGSPFCRTSGNNPAPILAGGASAGTFSAPAGLSINATTGVINLSASTPGSYTVTNTIAASGGCAASTATASVTVTAPASAAFAYATSTFCTSGTSTPTPTISGTSGGTFSAPAGLSINATTGAINLSASTPGSYTVTYAVGGACPTSATASVTITTAPLATFSYAAASYCASGGSNPAPTFAAGASAGTFSSTAGLSVNAATGIINLAASLPGTYTVTNTIAASGGCATSSATATVTITASANAAFSYAGTVFCASGSNPTPSITGTSGGTFSSTAGLSINPSTGAINLSASTPGSYTVTYAVGGACPASATASVTINATPATPTLTATAQPNGSVLLTATGGGAGASYQFYLNGQPVAGATGATYTVSTATQNGSYTVVATAPNSCASAASNAVTATVVLASAKPLAGSMLSVYPNPTRDGRLTVELSGYRKPVQLTVINAVGQVVYRAQVLPAATGLTQQPVDLSTLPTGVYVLRLSTEGGTDTRRIVRE
uniref:T9SS type A sorting domain-containing protein n=1 Tax=Hymenobacter sp. B81 TaxID=3344878 RepID=UPI0037DCCF5E